MSDVDHVLREEDFAMLAKRLDAYSGADIQAICTDAHIRGQLKVVAAKRFHKVAKNLNIYAQEN